MATAVTRQITKLPGRLYRDPTDLSADAPYGGTALGLTGRRVLRIGAKHAVITAEEWGEQIVKVVPAGTSVVFAVTLRGFDDDALAAVFPDTTTGSPSGATVVHFRADTGRAGVEPTEMKLLFVPRAKLRQPSILIRAAVPVLTEDASIVSGSHEEVGINCVWYGRPDTNEDVAVMGRLGDLSL